MKIIVGLGNPGKEYEKTRHNAGFMTIDKLMDKLSLKLDKNKFNALYTVYNYKGERIIFVKPLTYMNLSGQAVIPLMNFYDGDVDDLLVIHDDLDLPLGKLRLRTSGSSGGQKGMGNIIELSGSKNIKRIRVGISHDRSIDTKDYVIGKVSSDELIDLDRAVSKAADAVIYYLDHNFDMTMTNYNG